MNLHGLQILTRCPGKEQWADTAGRARGEERGTQLGFTSRHNFKKIKAYSTLLPEAQTRPPSTTSPGHFIRQREIRFPRRRRREGGLAAQLALPRAESIEAEGPGRSPAHMHAGPRTLRPSFSNVCDRAGTNLWDGQSTKTACTKVFFRVLFSIVENFNSNKAL